MERIIDLDKEPRAAHFRYFCGMQNPGVGVTVNVDVTELVSACKRQGRSFYLAMTHLTALAADEIPEFRRRIRNGGIVEFDRCPTSHIELLDNGAYVYCTLHHDMDDDAYFTMAEACRTRARSQTDLKEDEAVEQLYFITCLPWLHYTQLIQPTGDDSNPRFSWGRHEADGRGRLMLPYTVLAHHALVDGVHLGMFYAALNRQIERYCREV